MAENLPPPSYLDVPPQELTNFSVLSPKTLEEIPKSVYVDPLRQRRSHRKSKTGCDNCKKRRVKCDERTPCSNCVRRAEDCRRSTQCSTSPASAITRLPRMPSSIAPLNSKPSEAAMSSRHLRLFHHFCTYTLQTLLLPPNIWEQVLPLSFSFDFLMSTILGLAARHLNVLRPEDKTYPVEANTHLSRALASFRSELSEELTSTHVDAFIGTSLLLQYEVWSNTDFCSVRGDGKVAFDPSKEGIFALSSRLKQVFLRGVTIGKGETSVFLPYLRQNPLDVLHGAEKITEEVVTEYQSWFSYRRPLSRQSLFCPSFRHSGASPETPNQEVNRHAQLETGNSTLSLESSYLATVKHLCPILVFLPDTQGKRMLATQSSSVFTALARYIFSFPLLSYGPFTSMIQDGDPRAMLVLYHFYRAITILLPAKEFWWVHKRATISEAALKDLLLRQSTRSEKIP